MQNFHPLNSNQLSSPISQLSNLFIEVQTLLSSQPPHYPPQTSQISQNFQSPSLPNDISSLTCLLNKSISHLIDQKILEISKKYESQLRKLEHDNRRYIQTILYQNLQIDSMESQICSFIEMEEEFEEMKVKFKYEKGQFLDNERKENEILILRAENSNLKNILYKSEQDNKIKDERIERLKKKLKQCELKITNFNIKNSQSNTTNKELISTSSNTTHSNAKRNVINLNKFKTTIESTLVDSKSHSKNKKNFIVRKLYHRFVNEGIDIKKEASAGYRDRKKSKDKNEGSLRENNNDVVEDENSLSLQFVISPSEKNIKNINNINNNGGKVNVNNIPLSANKKYYVKSNITKLENKKRLSSIPKRNKKASGIINSFSKNDNV